MSAVKVIAMQSNRYGDGVDSVRTIYVRGARGCVGLVSIGGVSEGQSARQVDHGPKVPGPWAYAVLHAGVIDNEGGSAREIETALRIDLGEIFSIEGMPGFYRFINGHSVMEMEKLSENDEAIERTRIDGSGRTRADVEAEGMADARNRSKRDSEITREAEPAPETLTAWELEQVASGKAVRDGSGIKLINPDKHYPDAFAALRSQPAPTMPASEPITFDSETDHESRESESERYIVRGTDHAQDEPDTVSRPEVHDTHTGASVSGPWALNDWNRARTFAAELNETIEPTFAELQSRAIEGCSTRSHTLGEFEPLSETHSRAHCLDCGMSVDANSKPAPNEIDVSGEACAISCPTPSVSVAKSVEKLADGSLYINANGYELHVWAVRNSWPCSTLAQLQSIMIKLDAKGDLVELGANPEYLDAVRVDIPADELSAWENDALAQHERREIIKQARELDYLQMRDAYSKRPGRYEGNSDRPLVVAMTILDGVSGADDIAGSVDTIGYHARFGRFVLTIDSQGFHESTECESIAAAEGWLAEISDAEPSED